LISVLGSDFGKMQSHYEFLEPCLYWIRSRFWYGFGTTSWTLIGKTGNRRDLERWTWV